MMSLEQFENKGVPANRVVVGLPWSVLIRAVIRMNPHYSVLGIHTQPY
jgi:hypothetical protein